MAENEKPNISIAMMGHVDSGKSTILGRLIFELGGISEREMEKLRNEADRLGKSSFAFAFRLDKLKEERERGVTIAASHAEFFTPNYHYIAIDLPGHRDFIKNFISGVSQADVGVLVIPADGNFTTSIVKGDRKAGEIQGQSRAHARIANIMGIKQLVVLVNKMDDDVAKYSEERFNEIRDEVKKMLVACGWKKEFVDSSVAFIPISGWIGDNLIKKSEKMPWWKGVDVKRLDGNVAHVETFLDFLDKLVTLPERNVDKPLRMSLLNMYKIKGVGDIAFGRVESGVIKPGDEIIFSAPGLSNEKAKVFSVEISNKSVESGKVGDIVGINLKGITKENLDIIKRGSIISDPKNNPAKECASFTAQVQIFDCPTEIKVGYTPIVFIGTAHSACKITAINWKIGKETGGQKMENPISIKSNEMAEVVFTPLKPLCVESYKDFEKFSRCAFLEGNSIIMLGKIVNVITKD